MLAHRRAASSSTSLARASITGTDGYATRDNAPFGIAAVGVIYGTVTALGAMGVILIYRANRFINFAHGALGSMVGVIAIGLVLEHGAVVLDRAARVP